ncbi:MAG: heteromeric transposase endonuclease subunit TnsA [Acinetobacter sp.]|nr:MAG: heteromeric transposase endonuclease subunit TnsA [Acinetobacter sp.]
MLSVQQQQKWIKDGRGDGELSSYKPWLTVRDLSSRGRSHRVYGHKTKRTHHLLSDLELAIFLILEWNPLIQDIREQFPLRIEQTEEIADLNFIPHPAVRGIKQIMSTDFYVFSSDSINPRFSIQAKYHKDLEDTRTIEKLEIERRYWQSKKIPWQIITEQEIPKVVFDNIKWLYPVIRDDDHINLYDQIEFYVKQFHKYPNLSLINLAKKIDSSYDLEIGTSLSELRVLFAQRYFKFDLQLNYKDLVPPNIQLGDLTIWEEIRYAANQ